MAEGGVKDRAGDALTRAKRRMGLENPSAADDDGNVGIVRGALRALGEGNLDGFCEILASDVTWEAPTGGNFPGDDALNGRDEVKEQFLGDCGRTFTEFGFKPEKFLDADDENAVVVFGTFFGEGAEGDSLDEPSVMVFQFSGNEAEHVRIYTDSAAWPEVVTEEREKEWEEEEKEKEEKEKEEAKGESDSDDEDSDDSESKDSDDDSESKSEEKSESKSEDQTDSSKNSDDDSDSESKSEEKSESKSDDDSESKSDDDSKSESKSKDDSEG